MYCTGLGAVTPAVTEGTAAPVAMTPSTPLVYLTSTSAAVPTNYTAVATVSYSGLAPGFAGLYQVNFQVPLTVAIGTISVSMSMNGVTSNTVTMVTTYP
jgi:uncharacterized protein (TIGR03437 family)